MVTSDDFSTHPVMIEYLKDQLPCEELRVVFFQINTAKTPDPNEKPHFIINTLSD